MEEPNDNSENSKSLEPNEMLSDNSETKTELTRSPGRRSGSHKNSKKYSSKKFILPPPPRASPSSSSGFPGVSWNKRMGAWLAFYYDQGTRRSRTFHPKYFDMDVEKAKLAAIEFMKNIEKHPRCSLRKNKREKHDWSNSHYIKTSPEFDDENEGGLRRRRRAPNKEFGTDVSKRSPLSCSTQASVGEMYFDSLRPKFLNGVSREKQLEHGVMRMGPLKHEREVLDMTPNMFNPALMWGNCNMYVNSQDYCHSQDYFQSSQESTNFAMPSFDGFTSPTRNFSQESMMVGSVEEQEFNKLMNSMQGVDPLDPNLNYLSAYNCSSTSLSSPYLSPYTLYRGNEDSSMSGATGFQNMIQSDSQEAGMLYSPASSYILPIDSN